MSSHKRERSDVEPGPDRWRPPLPFSWADRSCVSFTGTFDRVLVLRLGVRSDG